MKEEYENCSCRVCPGYVRVYATDIHEYEPGKGEKVVIKSVKYPEGHEEKVKHGQTLGYTCASKECPFDHPEPPKLDVMLTRKTDEPPKPDDTAF